ncbi:MAG: hypothetical protein KF798_02700 [Candidatus Paracaedibacteraceae bacterium]|nr:hypothetical protein [Candidatus Paracaedibacteraceae bacterium]
MTLFNLTPSLFLVLGAVFLNTIGQIVMKAGSSSLASLSFSLATLPQIFLTIIKSPLMVGALGLYALSAVVWIMALSKLDLSQAYPMTSIGYILTAIIGVFAFGEVMTASRLVGLGLILVGVLILARG